MTSKTDKQIIDQGVCSLLDLRDFSPCVIGTTIEKGELTVYLRPTKTHNYRYYTRAEKAIIKIITDNLGLKHINTLLTQYDNSQLNVIFELNDSKMLVTLFRMKGISKSAGINMQFVSKLPANPSNLTMYFVCE